ncbi:MAG: ABC transporter ATP-binding protein, partial [Pirellulaceae bacterium]|nr:ABC transporter ATP-binding protein [Pirellulaceae bacterium]
MQPSIFSYILHYSKPQQLFLLVVILASYPFLYLSLDLPKLIINKAIGDEVDGDVYVVAFFGVEIPFHMDQIPFLLTLSFIYLFLVLINGGFKYYINVYKGQLGERLLRRLRYQLFGRILRFPLTHFRKVSQGELIPMITAEVEPLGGFIGTAFADPMFQGGQLVIILGFILIQDPILGAAAIAFYPLQMYVIPKLQRKVNALGKRRVLNVRKLSDQIGDSVSGIIEVHAHDTSSLELSRFTNRLGIIYWIRYEIYRRKFFIKFLNNFIDKLTPFFFFSIGGYLVIVGQVTVGALVAVLAAYKDLAGPWKEMLAWYQQKEDIHIKYDQVIEQFEPQGLYDEELLTADPPDDQPLSGEISMINLTLAEDDGTRPLDGMTVNMPIRQHTAIVGDSHSGKTQAALLLARLEMATGGTLKIDGHDITTLPEAVTGRRLTYVGSNAHVSAASVGENLLYGLKHRPVLEKDYQGDELRQFEAELSEAEIAGNSLFDYNADWVDYEAAGAKDPKALQARVMEVLEAVDFETDVYQMGLRGTIDPQQNSEIAEKILNARFALRDRLSDPAIAPLVELFD